MKRNKSKEKREGTVREKGKKEITILTRVTFLFVAFALLLVVFTSLVNYENYNLSMLQRYGNYSLGAAKIAASYLTGEQLQQYAETQVKDEAYYEMEEKLLNVCLRMDLQFLYVQMPTSDKETMYIFDVLNPNVVGFIPSPLGETEKMGDEFYAEKEVMQSNLPFRGLSPVKNKFGYFVSSYAPVLNAEGKAVGYVGVDIDMGEVTKDLMFYVIIIIVATVVIVCVCFALLLKMLRQRVLQPLVKIVDKTQEFVGGGIADEAFVPLEVTVQDEIGTLTITLNQMFRDIKTYTTRLEAETASRQQTSDDLKTANSIQQSLLPKLFPPYLDYTDVEIYADMHQAENIGTDFYDCFPVDHDHIAFVMVDVEGHGLSAALHMMVLQTLIKNRAVSGYSPREVLESINQQVCENNQQGMSARVFLGIYNARNNVLSYVNAGHQTPIIKRATGAAHWMLEENGIPLGLAPDAEYNTQAELMNRGDCLLLYTSGVTEAVNPVGKRFGSDTLLQLMKKMNTEVLVPQQVVRAVGSAVLSFAGEAEQKANITLMLMRRL